MRGGRRLLLPVCIGTTLLLLLVLPSFSSLELPKPQLLLHSVTLEGAAGGNPYLIASGAGFDRQTRLLLTPEIGNRQALRQSIPTWGRLEGITVRGDLAYLANHYRGMQVFDFTDPERPRQIGSLPLPGNALSLAVQGQIACVAAREEGLQIVDIGAPESLRLLGAAKLGGIALDVVIEGDLAYVANTAAGLQVVDLADPEHPRLLSSLPIPGNPYAVAVKAGRAYLAAARGGVQVVDVGDPLHPRRVGAVQTPDSALGLALQGDTLFVAARKAGLLAVDISRPQAPQLLGAADTPGTARAVAIDGLRAYVADTAAGLQVVDVADPRRPRLLGGYQMSGAAMAISISGDQALVAAGRDGLQILDLRQPLAAGNQAGGQGAARRPEATLADYIFLAARGSGVLVLDSRSTPPFAVVATLPTDGFARRLALAGNHLYVLGYRQDHSNQDSRLGIQVIDLEDLEEPRTVSRIETGERFGSFVLAGSDLWTLGEGGVCRFDVREPQAPRQAACLPLSGYSGSMVKRGDLLLVGDQQGTLHVIDIARPDAPRRIGTAALPWHLQAFSAVLDLALSGDLVLLADGRNGLLVYSIENPRQPKLVGGVRLPDAGFAASIGVAGHLAFLTDFLRGVYVIDFRDPEHLQVVGRIGGPGIFREIVIAAERIFYVTGEGGVHSFPLPVELIDIGVENEARLHAFFPESLPPGRYSTWMFNGHSRASLSGALDIPP